MTDSVDWTNPCARAAALRSAYFKLLGGANEVVISTRTLDVEERIEFGKGANLSALRAELDAAERECAALSGSSYRGRRRAIQVTYSRRPFGC